MTEDIGYRDGDIVWVKMNKLWWPGEVHGAHRLPSDFFDQFKKPPMYVVKFFQEHTYHYVNQLNQIAQFNCAKKSEFIKKGLDLYYAKHQYMEEFPADVAIAEKRTGGNPNIIYSKEFMPATKPGKAIPKSASKGSSSRSRQGQQNKSNTPSIPRVMIKPDHDTRILVPSVPSTSLSPTVTSTDSKYKCTLCNFSTNRINTLIWHQKTHSSPKTPSSAQRFEPTFTLSTENVELTKTPTSKDTTTDDEKIDFEEEKPVEPVVVPEKTPGKRLRQTKESRSKSANKAPKTENNLKKLLDDWSDDEYAEAGPSGITSNKNVSCIVLDTDENEDNVVTESSVKKKLKFGNENESGSTISDPNESEIVKNTPEIESDDLSQEIVSGNASANVVDDKVENKPRLGKRNLKDETISRQSGRIKTKDITSDEVQTPTQRHLRSGKPISEQISSPTPKRRGRSAKRNADDAVENENASEEMKESEVKPSAPKKTETINDIELSPSEKVSDELVTSVVVDQADEVKRSNSKTRRKGKPRRKEEIKLANNISVAVLVEKTTASPTTKVIEQKQDLPTDDNEFTDVVHKKIRYMSSTDDHRKSIETPKLPEPDKEINDETENQMIVDSCVESTNHTVDESVVITKETIDSDDQNLENNVQHNLNDVLQEAPIAEQIDINTTSTSKLDDTEFTENIVESSDSTDEQRFTQKCYKRKAITSSVSLPNPVDLSMPSEISSIDDIDTYELPSSSNLQQRTPKRYENTKNRRKSERRKDSESTRVEDFTAIVKAIDNECEKSDRQKSVDMNNDDTTKLEISNDSGKEEANSMNLLDQSSENSNSKPSTPEKADTSKEVDCFDFTEDEYLKAPPQVLNRRKRLPPAKVFELEDIDKIEDQRKLDEEALRIAQQREEENQKLQAELENLLNTTTPAALPEIPISHKPHENFPERRAEKDPEKLPLKENDMKDRMLPPKERNKRIFKYRNRNRRTDSDVKVTNTSCDVDDNNGNNSLHPEKIVETSMEEKQQNKTEEKAESNSQVLQIEENKGPSAHDLKIEIAETLINFPLLSPQTDANEKLNEKVIKQSVPSKSKESTRSARTIKKLRSAATNVNQSKVIREENTKLLKQSKEVPVDTIKEPGKFLVHDNGHNSKLFVPNDQTSTSIPVTTTSISTTQINTLNPSQQFKKADVYPKPNDSTLLNEALTKSIDKPPSNMGPHTQSTESVTASTITKPIRDFSRIRLIEKIDNHTAVQSVEEIASSKTHQLPLKKTVILTQTEGTSFITRIPKKRKSQMDDDIPAFVIERPKDNPDDVNESNNTHSLTKKEPKSFIVTKTIQKQITGELPKQNVPLIGGVPQNLQEINEGIDGNSSLKPSQQEVNTNATVVVNPNVSSVNTQISGASDANSIESPVIVSRVIQKKSHATSGQKQKTEGKRAVISSPTAVSHSNVLGNISIANRPCTIAPAKKAVGASYRKPTDMTGLTQKQIGIDGKGNPVMIYTKITPVVTQTPPVISPATFVMKRNEPVASTSQLMPPFTTSVQSNQGNQFVITSKGALITNKPFITTTHSTLLNQPTLTNRQNIQVHTQLIRSPNPQVFQQQHLSPQSNQIIIQTKPNNSLSQVSSIAPIKRQQSNRRSAVNKAKATEMIVPEQSNDRISSPSSYRPVAKEDNTTFKKRIVRRISKNQSTSTATQQQVVFNAEINHIGNATTPVPPLVPLNDPSPPISSRKQQTKQPSTQTMAFIQEPQMLTKTPHVDVEQQQENIQEILALPGDTPGFGGPPGSYFLCKLNEMGVYIPIDHQPLYLDVTDNTNLLKPNVPDGVMAEIQAVEMNEEIVSQQSPALFELNNVNDRVITNNQSVLSDQDANNPKYLINISDGQQLLVDQQSLMALANGEEFPQFVTSDGHQIILQGGQHDILSAIAFAEDVGLIAGQQILIPEDDLAVIQGQSGNHDILAAALAGTEAFSQEQFIDNVLIQSTNGVDIVDPIVYHQRHPRPQPTVTALTNATNAVLTQPPIMSTLEQPTKTDRLSPIGQNLDESLAVIGVTSNTNVPTSLELPITITNPAIAPKTTSMSSAIYPPPSGSTDHDLDYDIFSSTLPISHHLTQPLAINENYRTVNVINSIGDIDLDSNIVAVATTNVHQSFGRN